MISLWDFSRWKSLDPNYPAFLESLGITDLLALVKVGDDLDTIIPDMHARGIKVHASFEVCKPVEGYPDIGAFADVYDVGFQNYISTYMAEHAATADGVCLDYIRTGNTDGRINLIPIKEIVRKTYHKVSLVNPSGIVSCAANPYNDYEDIITLTDSGNLMYHNGRDPVTWINEGIMDIAFDMNYGAPFGGIPDMDRIRKTQQLVTDPKSIACLGTNTQKDENGIGYPSENLGAVLSEIRTDVCNNYGIFSAKFLTETYLGL